MENSSSPRRNLQPLLQEEAGATSSSSSSSRGASYAPPGAAAAAAGEAGNQGPPPSHQQEQPHATQESYDLNLTVTDEHGQVILPIEEEDGAHAVPQLPPLISYCSYVKYGCAFGKWLLLIMIINTIAITLVAVNGYFGYRGYLPFDTWKGAMLGWVWLGTAAWFFWSAKVIERDVERYDQMAQYEQGRLSEDAPSGDDASPGPAPAGFVPNYDAIYGQVSRKIDSYLSQKSTSLQHQQPQQPPPSGTSVLVNLSFALWGLFLGAGVFLVVGNLLGKHYQASCDKMAVDENGNSTTNSQFKADYAKISDYPEHVQEWITESKDPWSYPRHYEFDDDYHTDYNVPTYDDLPVAFETDMGLFCSMTDGTTFFAGQSPIHESTSGSRSDHLVLVQAGADGTVSFHDDIVNPRMFIPVAATMDKDKYTASQYCFTAAGDPKSSSRQRSWDTIIRTSTIYCITEMSDGSFEIQNKLVAWTDKSQRGPKLSAAASGNQILVAHIGIADQYQYQEVVAVTPGKDDGAITTKGVYHLTTKQEDGFYIYERGNHEDTKCIQGHVSAFSAVAGLVVLVASSLWLIIREGIPGGVVPLVFAVVSLFFALFFELGGSEYGGLSWRARRWATMVMAIGAGFFHIMICCGGNGIPGVCRLPAWVGRDMHICALYAWLLAFILIDLTTGGGDLCPMGLVLFGLSGLILDHPTVPFMGFLSILAGVVILIIWMFDGFPMYELMPAVFAILIGVGMISVGHCMSRNRGYTAAFCRPLSRACHSMFYGNRSAPASVNRPGRVPVSV